MTKKEAIATILLSNFNKSKKAVVLVLDTIKTLKPYDPNKSYTPKALEPYDALVSRYERSVELLIGKLFRSIQIFELGEKEAKERTVRDCLNLMTKLKLIEDTELWMSLRDLRNKISHDYLPDELKDFYELIQHEYAKVLKRTVDKIEKYIKEKNIK